MTSEWNQLVDRNWDEENDKEESCAESCTSWIQWFCSRRGNEFFCEIDEDYILDSFNLYKLKSKVSNYTRSLNIIIGYEVVDDELVSDDLMKRHHEVLYGLIHARFILTLKGMQLMREKYNMGIFGVCPRYKCNSQNVLPVGLSDELNTHIVCSYCPLCQECYESRCKNLDGAYFGTSFPGIFLQTYPDLLPLKAPQPSESALFGFRLANRESLIQIKINQGEYGWTNYKMMNNENKKVKKFQ